MTKERWEILMHLETRTAGHLQSGSADPHGPGHSHSGRISVTWYRPTYRFGPCAHLTLHCWPSHGHVPNWLDALSLSQPHTSGTLYLLTFDCARAFPHLSATWKPICSDWLCPPALLQVPQYLRTSRHYRNVLLLFKLSSSKPLFHQVEGLGECWAINVFDC